VLRGLSNEDIARQMFLSRYPVGDHIKAILSKVGAHSKQQFIAFGLGSRHPTSLVTDPARS
jgi:DNA-binding CsgD family transcriptional regulator